jgi:hypothetical protein
MAAKLEKDLESWKKLVNAERAKNERLLDQVMRKDREIHRMIQRKVCVDFFNFFFDWWFLFLSYLLLLPPCFPLIE